MRQLRVLVMVLALAGLLWALAWSTGGSRWTPSSTAALGQETAPSTALGANPSTGLGTSPSTAPATSASQASVLWARGIEKALVGKFGPGLADLRKAAKLDPDEKKIAESAKLVEEHLAATDRWDHQRGTEFEQAADRVRRSLLAESYRQALDRAKLFQRLREKVTEMDRQFSHIPGAETIEESDPDGIEDMKAQAAEATGKMLAALDKAVARLAKNDTGYAAVFRDLSRILRARIKIYASVWASIAGRTAKERHSAARKVRDVEEELVDALVDLEGIVADQPWRAGLAQARLARTMAPDPDKMDQYGWYRQLVQSVIARGENALKEGKWYDALNAYNGLHDLDPDSPEYGLKRQIARRHVRVLGLYGRKPDPNAVADPDDYDTRWQELIEGVDSDIVHKAISQLDNHYVAAVDYRKLIRGALTAVKVLAETPEAANSFEGLADKVARTRFVEAVKRELANVDKNDRVDHTSLQMALNTVLRESERSVNIPLGVLALEFTDGFLQELDRFSSMIWPSDVDDFKKQTMGQFFGVGIQITKEPNAPLKVVSPLANSPALREGIKSGDLIVTVDGKPTEPLSIDRLVKLITGPKGTAVVLGVKSRGQDEPRKVTLVRDEIRIHTVKGWRRQPGGDGDNWQYLVDPSHKIAYIRVSQFTEETHGALIRALREMKQAGSRSVILDLRFNPGGLLEASKRVVDEFLRKGRIVSTRGRQKAQREYSASDGGAYTQGHLVVLVNEMSASAAEIVSGALRDWKRAVVVGKRTYGKGSVQNVLQIPSHVAYLKLTTAYYYLPSGRLLHRRNGEKTWGVDPDVEVRVTPRQTKRWLDLRRKTDLLQDVDPELLRIDLAEEYQADMQLNTAVLLLRLMQLQETRPAA
ncbi:MAG TPA: S41 family peptidase [Phycisphaerae bacterium]|nr:S41 family peptidase [Phycisphaerae bacterium]